MRARLFEPLVIPSGRASKGLPSKLQPGRRGTVPAQPEPRGASRQTNHPSRGTQALRSPTDKSGPQERSPRKRESRARWSLSSENTRQTDNDPSAGSPTETLLRLLLPLNATVWSSSRQPGRVIREANSPRTSLKHSIGSSDGRCVQRAGT